MLPFFSSLFISISWPLLGFVSSQASTIATSSEQAISLIFHEVIKNPWYQYVIWLRISKIARYLLFTSVANINTLLFGLTSWLNLWFGHFKSYGTRNQLLFTFTHTYSINLVKLSNKCVVLLVFHLKDIGIELKTLYLTVSSIINSRKLVLYRCHTSESWYCYI
jgi:hypothetical protein